MACVPAYHWRQDYNGCLSFTTDAWSSPNHCSFVVICVHLERNGSVLTMPLDVVEVAQSHTGMTLANTFRKVLEEFSVTEKVNSMDRM
jgi:hypothetical protein